MGTTDDEPEEAAEQQNMSVCRASENIHGIRGTTRLELSKQAKRAQTNKSDWSRETQLKRDNDLLLGGFIHDHGIIGNESKVRPLGQAWWIMPTVLVVIVAPRRENSCVSGVE